MYKPRYIYNRPPGYDGDQIAVQVNLTGNELTMLETDAEYRTEAVQTAYASLQAAQQRAQAAQIAILDVAQSSDENDRAQRLESLTVELAEFTAEIDAANAALDVAAAEGLTRRGELLARTFGNRVYVLDGIQLDFTTGPAALATMRNSDTPRDIVAWLGMAVANALGWDRENIAKNSAATWTTGIPSGTSSR